MLSHTFGRTIATLVRVAAVAVVVGVGLYAYVAVAGRHILNQTLIAQRDGAPIPANVVLDTRHLSVHMRTAEHFSSLLKDGFTVGPSSLIWEAPFPPGVAYPIEVNEDIGLVCEVYRGAAWRIPCGQLRCAKGDPCRFDAARLNPRQPRLPSAETD